MDVLGLLYMSLKACNYFSGQIMPAAFMLGLGYVGCDKVLAVALVSLAVGLNGLTQAGFNVNHLDIAPVYAGTLMGCTNAIATIPGFVGPQLVGALTYKNVRTYVFSFSHVIKQTAFTHAIRCIITSISGTR